MTTDSEEATTHPALRGPEDMVRLLLRSAIPTSDIGSRGAIQYAKEIAEFMVFYGIEFCANKHYDPMRIVASLHDLDTNDPPITQ